MGDFDRICWATDLHMGLAENPVDFCTKVDSLEPSGIIITGDISIAPCIHAYLKMLDTWTKVPIWFVLGNHDFYSGDIDGTRLRVSQTCKQSKYLHYLTANEFVDLGPETALVGHDGWCDGRFGDFFAINPQTSRYYQIKDYYSIQNLIGRSRQELLVVLKALGDAAAEELKPKLIRALSAKKNVIVAVHSPPFEGACWYQGQVSGPAYLPHFSSKVMGNMLLEVGMAHPENKILVLCGHTHYSGVYKVGPNLLVRTGGAQYGKPEPCGVISAASLDLVY